MNNKNLRLIMLVGVFGANLVVGQQPRTDPDGVEGMRKMRERSAKTYLLRPRSGSPSRPAIQDLRFLLSQLQAVGFTLRPMSKLHFAELKEGDPVRRLWLGRSQGKITSTTSVSQYVEMDVFLGPDVQKTEEYFVNTLAWIQIAPEPGTYDGRLLGDNSAYAPNDRISRIYFYSGNAYVKIYCLPPMLRTRESEAVPFPRGGTAQRDPALSGYCSDLARLVERELLGLPPESLQ